jgi:hypothetical protein
MIYDFRDPHRKAIVRDAFTGCPVNHVISIDTNKDEVKRYLTDDKGNIEYGYMRIPSYIVESRKVVILWR